MGGFRQFLSVVVCIFVLGVCEVQAAQHWKRVSTSHFEIYTTADSQEAIRALQGFEQVRSFFLQTGHGKNAPAGRVRIIAFSSEKEFRPYRPNSGAFAFYQKSETLDYIVMQDITTDNRRTAVHEYTHLIVEHLNLKLPIWLNEGLAELYSTVEPHGDKALVGRPVPGHYETLNERPWMKWETLFAVDDHSPYYNEASKMSVFYAQSWLMTHMLALSPAYSPKFQDFLVAMANGMPAEKALESVYNKTVEAVGRDAQSYARQTMIKGFLLDAKVGKQDLDPSVETVNPLESKLVLAELLSTRPALAVEAKQQLLELEPQDGSNVEVEETLGYLCWRQNEPDEARKHFKNAVDHGSVNANVIFNCVEFLQAQGPGSDTVVINLLQRAVELDPENAEARLDLANVAARAKQYGVALSALSAFKTVKPEQAFQYFSLQAFVRANLKDFAGAEQSAKRALPYSPSPDQREYLEGLLRNIERRQSHGQTAGK